MGKKIIYIIIYSKKIFRENEIFVIFKSQSEVNDVYDVDDMDKIPGNHLVNVEGSIGKFRSDWKNSCHCINYNYLSKSLYYKIFSSAEKVAKRPWSGVIKKDPVI